MPRFVSVEADIDTRYEEVVYAIDSAVELARKSSYCLLRHAISKKY